MSTALSLFGILLTIFLTAQSCPSKFKNLPNYDGLKYCATKLKFTVDEFLDMWVDPEKNDKCITKCSWEKHEMMNGDKPDFDKLNKYLEEQAPQADLPKLKGIVNQCKETAKMEKLDGKSPEEVCKAFHSFDFCFDTNAYKLC